MEFQLKHYITLLLLAHFTLIFSQSTSFPTGNASWSYSFHFEESVFFDNHQLDGDSLYDGITYQKITNSVDPYNGDNSGLLREENKVVYFVPKDSLNEVVLYDFNLLVGDTFHIDPFFDFAAFPYVTVLYIDSIMTNDGIYRKFFQLSEGANWIEGIGADYGTITYPWYQYSLSGDSRLQCFSNDSLHVFEKIVTVTFGYETFQYDCDGLIINVEEIDPKQDFTIFPNPFNNELTVSVDSDNPIQKLTLYDTSLKMLGQSINESRLQLNQSLSSGMYFLEITINDKRFFQKVIRE